MLKVTLYRPGASAGIVPGAFHDCPALPSISTVAPIGTEETINQPSAVAGEEAEAVADVFLPGRTGRADEDTACVCCCAAGSTASWLNGAAAFAVGSTGCCVVALSGGSSGLGFRWKTIAKPIIRQSPPTTPPTSFQWFADFVGTLDVVCGTGMRVVPGEAAFMLWVEEAGGMG